jgi:hypothetical protein
MVSSCYLVPPKGIDYIVSASRRSILMGYKEQDATVRAQEIGRTGRREGGVKAQKKVHVLTFRGHKQNARILSAIAAGTPATTPKIPFLSDTTI